MAGGAPTNLGPIVNSSAAEIAPSISADGLCLYFCDALWGVSVPQRPNGYGNGDLWLTTRATRDDDWGPPENLGPVVNSSAYELFPNISFDGLSLYFSSNRQGGFDNMDIWVTTRATKDDDWSAPINLGPTVNSSSSECDPSISADGLTLVFSSSRPGGEGQFDLWVTRRATRGDEWETPLNLGPIVNTSIMEWSPKVSADGSTLHFCSNRSGGIGYYDLWQV
jgi:OOP family OmpA-OmpF porin